jgi:hypothetical protein
MTELRFTKLRRLFVLLYVVLIVSPNPWPRFRRMIPPRSPMFAAPNFQPSHTATDGFLLTPRVISQPLGKCPHVIIVAGNITQNRDRFRARRHNLMCASTSFSDVPGSLHAVAHQQ